MKVQITLMGDDNRPLGGWEVEASTTDSGTDRQKATTDVRGGAVLTVKDEGGQLTLELSSPAAARLGVVKPVAAQIRRTLDSPPKPEASKADAPPKADDGAARADSAAVLELKDQLKRAQIDQEQLKKAQADQEQLRKVQAELDQLKKVQESAPRVVPADKAITEVSGSVAAVRKTLRSTGLRLGQVEITLSGDPESPTGVSTPRGVRLASGGGEGAVVSQLRFTLHPDDDREPANDAEPSAPPVKVPNVVGYTAELARRKLAATGLSGALVPQSTNTAERDGQVLSQVPAADTLLADGGAVRLFVGQLIGSA